MGSRTGLRCSDRTDRPSCSGIRIADIAFIRCHRFMHQDPLPGHPLVEDLLQEAVLIRAVRKHLHECMRYDRASFLARLDTVPPYLQNRTGPDRLFHHPETFHQKETEQPSFLSDRIRRKSIRIINLRDFAESPFYLSKNTLQFILCDV